MIPIRLRLSGFTSYSETEPAEVDFTLIDLACISGSNGAGKSSLLDGITYALYGEARKRDEGLINNASKRAEVKFDFEYEGLTYRVIRALTRGKGSQVDFMVQNAENGWKTLTERTVTETNAAIARTLRLDYETFVNASFFLQGKADSFSTQKPSDRKRILSSILGLDQWERYRERTQELQREKNNDLVLVNAKLEEIQAELNLEAERKATLESLEQELRLARSRVEAQQGLLNTQLAIQQKLNEQRNTVALLQRQFQKDQVTCAEAIETLRVKEDQLNTFKAEIERAAEIEAAYQAYLNLREALSGLDRLAEKVKPIENDRQALLNRLEVRRGELRRELELLTNDQLAYSHIANESKGLAEQLKDLENQVAMLEKEIARKEAISTEIELLQNQSISVKEENAGLKTQMEDLKTRLDSVNALEGAECPLCGQPLSEHNRERLAEELGGEGKRMGNLYRANQANLDENQVKQRALMQQRDELSVKERELLARQRDHDRIDQKLAQFIQQETDWITLKEPRLVQLANELEENAFLPEVRTEIGQLEANLIELGYDPQQHNRLRTKETTDRQAQDNWHNLQLAQGQLETLSGIVKEQQKLLETQQKALDQSQKEFDAAAAKLATDEAGLPDLRLIQNELATLQESEAFIGQRVGGARQQVNALDTQRERQSKYRKEQETLRVEIGHLKSLDRAFGKDGVPAMLIEQALPELEEQTNTILQRLSNYTMSVTFSTQRAYKDAKREDKKETLDILISDGASTRDYETYSGGEAFRVNFAIRLALSRVLSHRAGARLQTLVIDEGFGNQDAEGRQRLIETINLMRNDFAKILIITHIEELKDVFPSRIEVTKGQNGSKVELILS
ncbi:MAG: SMC family ATPase [Anaerolineaceae bacterium]